MVDVLIVTAVCVIAAFYFYAGFTEGRKRGFNEGAAYAIDAIGPALGEYVRQACDARNREVA